MSTAYDAAGRATFRRTSSGGLSQSSTNAYDGAGRRVWTRGPDGIETHYLYDTNVSAGTQNQPPAGTQNQPPLGT